MDNHHAEKDLVKRTAKLEKELAAKNHKLEIEAALEKVRARTMAMQRSDELADASHVLERQVAALGIKTWGCAFHIFKENDSLEYHSNADGVMPTFVIPRTYVWQRYYEACQRGETLIIEERVGEACTELYEYMAAMPIVGEELQKMKAAGIPFPTYQVEHAVSFKYGYLLFITFEQVPEAHDIFIRFAKVFEQTYTRFLDLQTAEAQARESQIQLALERVRARTMAMQKSDELVDTAALLFQQIKELGIQQWGNSFQLWDDDMKAVEAWTCTQGMEVQRFKIPTTEDPAMINIVKGAQKGEDLHVEEMGGEALEDHYKFMYSLPIFKEILDNLAAAGITPPKFQVMYAAYFSYGYILFITHEPFPEAHDIFKRFAKVFEQTYTRFLDLQKAETQAREAKIEAALEKVRARTMAMQRSDELANVATVLFQQVKALGVSQWTCGFNIWEIGDKDFTFYPGSPDGDILPPCKVPLTEDAVFILFDESRRRGDELCIYESKGEIQKEHYRYMQDLPGGLGDLLQNMLKAGFQFPHFQIDHIANFSNGNLLFITYEHFPEMHDIFKRFAKVFEQTYTRFLDLQKAEAQAREAQIQLALERVRARTMAMQKSDELPETAAILFEQFKSLGQELMQMTIGIVNEAEGVIEFSVTDWSGSGAGVNRAFNLSIEEPSLIKKMYAGWKENKRSIVVDLTGKDLENWISYRNKMSGVTVNSADTGGRRVITSAFFSKGHLSVSTPVLPVTGSIQLLERFAQVFDLTYTRFLDLQKAEAQARESQIQLALERVRARTMAMQKSDELMEASNLLLQQVQSLGIPVWACGYNIWEIGEKVCTAWMSVLGAIQPSFRLPLTEHRTFIHMYESRLKAEPFYVEEVSGEELADHYRYMFSLPDFKEIATKQLQGSPFPLPQSQTHHVFNFKHGNLIFLSAEAIPEARDIFKRFTAVFEQTYTRFLDLQKAEAQARESQIELGLERVRARAMAMQKSDELSELVDTVFKELTKLDFALTWCIINIIDESSMSNMVWAANPDIDKAPDSYHMKFEDYPFHHAMMKGWKERKIKYVYVLEGLEKKVYDKYLFNETEFRKVPAAAQAASSAMEKYVVSFSFSNFGGLQTVGDVPLSDANLDILSRFGKVFDLTYTRFNDLKQAEAQARESQIQLALERVRARTMAMQKSNEMTDVAGLLFEQVSALGIKTWTAGFNVWSEDNNSYVDYITSPQGGFIEPYTVYTETAEALTDISNARKSGVEFDVQFVEGEKIKQLYLALTKLDEKQYEVMLHDGVRFPSHQYEHFVFGSKVSLMFITYEPVPEAHDIFKRLGKVFEQTYTRFLDLQKAEAQAREAQIEAALERVRSRSMGMQKSEELKEVIQVVYEQFVHLNIYIEHTGFIMDYKARDDMNIWLADKHEVPFQVTIPYFDCAHWNSFNEAKEKGKDFFANKLSFEEKNKFYRDLFKLIPGVPDETKEYYFSCAGLAISTVLLDNVCLYIENFSGIPYSDEENNTLMRFGKVFQQTYTRFLDLQKAEAQAREAKIETALEKVRSRTMAMQHSDELGDVAEILFKQVKELGIHPWSTGFNIWQEGNDAYIDWITNPSGGFVEPYTVDLTTHPFFREISDAKKRGEDFHVFEISGEPLRETYALLMSFAPKQFEGFMALGFSFPTRQLNHYVFGAQVSLMFITHEPYLEAHDIFKRFGKVFEQTYTRFLDLQKAEAQAREAQIEAALERVRSRTMGMQRSTDLQDTASILFSQVQALGAASFACGFNIWDDDRKAATAWMAREDGIAPSFKTSSAEDVFFHIHEAAQRGESLFVREQGGDELETHYRYMATIPVFKEVAEKMAESGVSFPSFQVMHCAFFSQGYLMFITYQPVRKAHDIFKRFAKVFEQTYTRFLDLQKAEAQGREAIKRASVDRVRAEIASMRTTNDLERITPLIWNELTTLGVPFVRCGVFIMDEEKQLVETHLSTPDGRAIASFTSTFSGTQLLNDILPYWQRKEVYKAHWDEARFMEQAKSLVEQGAITSGEKYLTENRPTDLYLHFLPFLQGMLYAGNTAPLSDDALQLMQNLADAFSTAYARYEDFNKLEVAKEQIEKTLVDLKQAQTQLVQSEKMASLGELTAGIAHEIQNPLNFVNNFSDVNKELLEELKEEADKGNIEEIKAIANDVINNEEKINHHGKRADAIVKNMLQHSRSSGAAKELTDINKLADEYLRLSYHGLRAKDKSFNADFKTELDSSVGKINVIPQDIGRVLLNLVNNAFYATNEKKKTAGENYKPLVSVLTKKINNNIEIAVTDNGKGIPASIKEKIFQPFFTTKPTGQGTGLGLSLSYDIIKAHNGEIRVESKEGEGSEFVIQLPV